MKTDRLLTAPVPSVRVLDTDSVAPAGRLDVWRDHVRETCGALEVRGDQDLFTGGTIMSSRFGDVQVSLISAAPHVVCRSRRSIGDVDDGHIYVSAPLQGRLQIVQDDGTTTVQHGEIVSFDGTRPYMLTVPEQTQMLAVRFAHRAVGLKPDSTRPLTAQPWPGRAGLGALACGMFTTLATHLSELDGVERASLGNAITGVVRSLFLERLHSAENARVITRRVLLLRVQNYGREHLDDCGLTPTVLARRHNISLRYLQSLFAEQGTSPAKWLRDERLARCREDLCDPRFEHLTVAAIGARWGLSGGAQISRLFRMRYGLSPSAFRKRQLLTPAVSPVSPVRQRGS